MCKVPKQFLEEQMEKVIGNLHANGDNKSLQHIACELTSSYEPQQLITIILQSRFGPQYFKDSYAFQSDDWKDFLQILASEILEAEILVEAVLLKREKEFPHGFDSRGAQIAREYIRPSSRSRRLPKVKIL